MRSELKAKAIDALGAMAEAAEFFKFGRSKLQTGFAKNPESKGKKKQTTTDLTAMDQGLIILNLIKDNGENLLEHLTLKEAGIGDQDLKQACFVRWAPCIAQTTDLNWYQLSTELYIYIYYI